MIRTPPRNLRRVVNVPPCWQCIGIGSIHSINALFQKDIGHHDEFVKIPKLRSSAIWSVTRKPIRLRPMANGQQPVALRYLTSTKHHHVFSFVRIRGVYCFVVPLPSPYFLSLDTNNLATKPFLTFRLHLYLPQTR